MKAVGSSVVSKPMAKPLSGAFIGLSGGDLDVRGWHIDGAGRAVSRALLCEALGNYFLSEAAKRNPVSVRVTDPEGWQ